MCIIDHYNRFVVLKAVSHKPTSRDVINFIKQKWNSVFQMPTAISTDRGTEFTSAEFITFVTIEMGCTLCRSSPYYPQGNSVNGASHRAIGVSLSMLEKEDSCIFEDTLLLASSIHNNSPHTATNNTPFFMLFGFKPTLPGRQGLQQQSKSLE